MPTANALARLAVVAPLAGVDAGQATPLDSDSNDAWLCGDVVVRVCWRGDRQRMLREAELGVALPTEIGYPKVLGAGRVDDLSWMTVARVDGTAPWGTWKAWPVAQQQAVIEDLAARMQILHEWTPPASIVAEMRAHDAAMPTNASDMVGHDLLTLPVARADLLGEFASAMPFVDAGVIRDTMARIAELAAHDLFATPHDHVVHGDLGFTNMLVHEGRLNAVIDFEWVRLAPPDAELVSLMRHLGQWKPEAHRVVLPPAWDWLRAAYPALFSAPDLRERLWLCELVYVLRQMVVWPPDGPPETQEPLHPVHILPLLVEAPWDF